MSLPQLAQLLPLPKDELQQVLDYASTLSKLEAASHFGNLLGDSPLAIDFIASFNARRIDPPPTTGTCPTERSTSAPVEPLDAVPRAKRAPKKRKPPLHTPEARKIEQLDVGTGTVYNKRAQQDLDYVPQRSSRPGSRDVSRPGTPHNSTTTGGPSGPPTRPTPKQHTSSAGGLISDEAPKSKPRSNQSSRSSTPKGGATTKVSVTGGTPMAGQSTAIADLDAAIRVLEMTTNPKLGSAKSRRCGCIATRHPLQSSAPNCLSCGKVICMKEGLGPCTFCGSPLLSPDDVQTMIRELKSERGKERMAADAQAHRRADVSRTPAPFAAPRGTETTPIAVAEANAREHRDRLLGFQAQNARRTTVRDEASDFDVSGVFSGAGSMWASPEKRARELKRQQKLMREMEHNARPEYEKRRQVVRIDLARGRVVREMAVVERRAQSDDDVDDDAASGAAGHSADEPQPQEAPGNRGGAFRGNPLLGSLIRPVFKVKAGTTGAESGGGRSVSEGECRTRRRKGWRKVQDDLDDNEGVILDGGVYGYEIGGAREADEPPSGSGLRSG